MSATEHQPAQPQGDHSDDLTRFLASWDLRRQQQLLLIRAKLTGGTPAPRGYLTRRRHAARLAADVWSLRNSALWSDDLYRRLHPDVAAVGADPARHYLTHGWRELRKPHPLFDTGWYLLENPDVFSAGLNPLIHYLRHGAGEGRKPNLGFDGAWYLEHNRDVAAAGMNPLAHYALYGAAEQRWPHPLFDPQWYAEQHGVGSSPPWRALAHYIETGFSKGLMPNPLFDPVWYRRTNIEVGAADLDPVAHYLHAGWRAGWQPSPDFEARWREAGFHAGERIVCPLVTYLHGGQALRADVVYVGHAPSNLSHSYRVRHPVEVLNQAGISARWIKEADLARHESLLSRAGIVVFARTAWTPQIGKILEVCRAANVIIAFDIDDYIFDSEVANSTYVDGLRFVAPEELHAYCNGVALYRRMLLESDVVLASTPLLVEAARALGKTGYLLENGSRASVVRASEEAAAGRAATVRRDDVVIGYASGTKTHQRDFATAGPALARILEEFPEVRLQIVGVLDLSEFPELARYRDRIAIRSPVPIEDLPIEYAKFDINLAPLEIGNPYCEAKSALKFLEAGLVGVPTVASATEPFRNAVDDGKTGFLAATDDEWHTKLRLLVTDPALRREMGAQAKRESAERAPLRHREQTLSIFRELLKSKSGAAASAPLSVPDPYAVQRPLASGRLRIGWVVPGLIIGGGGHRNILRAAHFLQSFGHDVALYFTMDNGRSAAEFKQLVRRHFYPFEGDVFVYEERGRGDDVLFATHWTTVKPAMNIRPAAREVIYFVQDFEPSFAAMSSEYILAENTYRKGLYAITSGVWCERVLRHDFGMEADHFRFPIDRGIYHPRPKAQRENRIVFFAKPEMPRRCFELGVEALREVHQKRPDLEIVLFGSSKARGLVDFPVTLKDVLPGIGDLADLYASARLGIVFSTTNPSLVPYEMMACGLPVVDLARAGNEANYGDRLDIAFLANPEPEIMAEEIVRLIADEDDLAARSRSGLTFVADFPTEMEMAKRVEALILARVNKSADGGAGSGADTPQRASLAQSTREAAATA